MTPSFKVELESSKKAPPKISRFRTAIPILLYLTTIRWLFIYSTVSLLCILTDDAEWLFCLSYYLTLLSYENSSRHRVQCVQYLLHLPKVFKQIVLLFLSGNIFHKLVMSNIVYQVSVFWENILYLRGTAPGEEEEKLPSVARLEYQVGCHMFRIECEVSGPRKSKFCFSFL